MAAEKNTTLRHFGFCVDSKVGTEWAFIASPKNDAQSGELRLIVSD